MLELIIRSYACLDCIIYFSCARWLVFDNGLANWWIDLKCTILKLLLNFWELCKYLLSICLPIGLAMRWICCLCSGSFNFYLGRRAYQPWPLDIVYLCIMWMFKMSFKELVVASTNGSVVCNDIVKLICLLLFAQSRF